MCFFTLCLLATASPLAGDRDSLEARLAPLVRAHKGKVAIAVKHLLTGENYSLNANEPMPTASLIKLAIMVETYQQALEGKVALTDPVTLRQEDKVPGSGILTEHFSAGARISLRDAIRLMIVYSDNTATNLVLDRIGIASTNTRMEDWGLPQTRVHAKVFRGSTTSIDPARTKRFGLGSTTALESLILLERLQCGLIVSPAARMVMLNHLKRCDDREKFPRFLPEGTVLAHKTGSVSASRTDAGILYLESGPVALCVLTAENADQSWRADNAGNLLCAKVAKEVHDYFTRTPKSIAGD